MTSERARRALLRLLLVEPLSEADGGGWLASVPSRPGCYGDGATPAEAIDDALAALDEWEDAVRQLRRERKP
jgi:antitoxin HicB